MHMSSQALTCHYLYLEDVLMRYSCIIAGVSGSSHNTRLHLDIEEVTTIWAWVSMICSLMATAWVLCSSFYYWNGLSLCCLPGTWSKSCLLAQASAATGYSPSNRAPAGKVFILERGHGHSIIHSTQSFFYQTRPWIFLPESNHPWLSFMCLTLHSHQIIYFTSSLSSTCLLLMLPQCCSTPCGPSNAHRL
jgi:hypothetical protein